MNPTTRRSFVRKSLATTVSITFTGLIRAHGEGGGGTTNTTASETTWDPDQTTIATTYPLTTWDPNQTTIYTTFEDYTTWNPAETTEVTTASALYDINKVDLWCPVGTKLSFDSAGYAQSGPSPTFFPIIDLSSDPVRYGFYKLKVTMAPKSLSPHPDHVTLNEEVEFWIFDGVAISRQSHEFEIICTCDTSTGNLSKTDKWITVIAPLRSYSWTETVYEIPVLCELAAVLGPVSVVGEGTNKITISGDVGILLTKNTYDTGVNPKKTFKIEVESHLHP